MTGIKAFGVQIGVALSLAAAAMAAPAASADVVLNEISCDDADWIELVNTSNAPADISGWLLADDPLDALGDPMTFANPTVIPANGYLAVERNEPGGFTFGISCSDTIRLADAGVNPVDEETLPDIDFDLDTWGRDPDGSGSWRQTFPTMGASNAPSPAAGDLAAPLFDPTEVVEIDLGLSPESIADLNAEPGEYTDGTFELTTADDQTYVFSNVGVRLKGGFGSFRPLTGKAAFKVRFPHSVPGRRLLGLKTLTLNNMVQDPSNVHEVLAYESFRSAGIPAPRTGYAYLRVNGEDYGLYLNVETLDDVSLPRWFDTTQHLYEGEWSADVAPGGAGAFDVDEGSETDLGDLEALIAAVNDAGPPGFTDRVVSVADLEQMTRMWAVEKYVGHWDGYSGFDSPNHPNNFYLHSDVSGVFTILPWGTDQAWDMRIDFGGQSGILFDQCLADLTCAALFREAVLSARTTIAGLGLDGLANGLAAQLAPWQAADPRREYTVEEIADAVAATRAFIDARPGDADAWLAETAPEAPLSTASDPARLARAARRKRCKGTKKRAARAPRCKKRKRGLR